MNARGIIPGLILIILSLVAGVVYLLFREPALPPASSGSGSPTNIITRVAVKKFTSTNYFARTAGFRWSSIESTNYTAYIENLRSIGCPEETIRDIVIADIAKLFASRRAELFASVRSGPYWQTENPFDRRLQQSLKALETEQRTLVRQLLEVDLDAELEKFGTQAPARPVDLGFLPQEKQSGVLAIRDRFRQREAALHEAANGIWSDADDEAVRRLERQEEEELKKLLSPQEFEDYQLRHSPLSADLRTSLFGFEPSEDEFKKLYQARAAYEEALSHVPADSKDGTIREDLQEVLNGELKGMLGEERFKQYQKLQEPSFQTLTRLGDRFGLAPAVTDEAFGYLQAAESQALRLHEDASLDEDRRDEALRQISEETSRRMRGVLGNEAFRVFQGAGGNGWLNLGLPSR